MKWIDGRIIDVDVAPLEIHEDERGGLVELWRNDFVPMETRPVMAYASFTASLVFRGPHEHKTQSDRFLFVGPGVFTVFLWDYREDSPTYGFREKFTAGVDPVMSVKRPTSIVIPPGVVHGYRAESDPGSYMINAPNALHCGKKRKEPEDVFRWERQEGDPFEIF